MTFPHLSVNGVCGGIMNIKLLPSLPVQSYQSEHVSPVPRTDIHNMNTELFLQGGGNHQKIFWQISLPWPDIALSDKSMKMVKICQSLCYLRAWPLWKWWIWSDVCLPIQIYHYSLIILVLKVYFMLILNKTLCLVVSSNPPN